jgi:hypothetical protein
VTVVLGVHGIGNYQPGVDPSVAAGRLALAWAPHLAAHGPPLDGVQVRVSYFAHLLAVDHFQGSVESWFSYPGAAGLLAAWARQLGAPDEVMAGRTTQPIRQLLSWIATSFGLESAVVYQFAAVFLREVHTYLHNPKTGMARKAACSSLAADIRRYSPDLIIAHSLGSVVAYETLWEYADLRLGSLITLGSPLGIPDVIFDRLIPVPVCGRGAKPPNVGLWSNVADIGDLVAIPPRLSKRFDGLHADVQASIARFGFHRVADYLDSPVVGDLLASYISPPAARSGEP